MLTQKYLLEEDYKSWKREYDEANAVMINRDKTVEKVIESL